MDFDVTAVEIVGGVISPVHPLIQVWSAEQLVLQHVLKKYLYCVWYALS